MKRMRVTVKTSMTIRIPSTDTPHKLTQQVLEEMDYDFESTTDQCHIEDMEIVDWDIVG